MRSCHCTLGDVGMALLASAGITSWAMGGACNNDAGAGTQAEGEACLVNDDVDSTNGGCNSSPSVFVSIGGTETVCGIGSNYNITQGTACASDADCPGGQTCDTGQGLCQTNNRDTDWYLVTPAALAAADADANGTVRITSTFNNAEFDMVTFLIEVSDLAGACNTTVLNSVGCFDTQTPVNNASAVEVVSVAANTEGIVVFAAPGQCSGAGIFDGFECATTNNDYNLTILLEDGFETCGDPPTNPNPCNEPNDGVSGCEDPSCCDLVCVEFNALCCTSGLGWIQACATAAIDLGCAPALGGPIRIATGDDNAAEGYLAIASDPFGSWSSDTFGGDGAGDPDWGDEYNPHGAATLQEASFTNGWFFFSGGDKRELLSNILNWQNTFGPDPSVERALDPEEGSVEFDDSGDGVSDRLESGWHLTGADLDLTFALTQTIGLVTPAGADPVGVLTQTLTITNNSGSPIDFELVRHGDLDLVWDGGADFANDVVGTNTNGVPSVDRFVAQTDPTPETGVVISSPEGDEYYGAKNGIDPDGAGPGPAMGFGTDTQQWDAFGVPPGWENYIAGLGANLNGESGDTPTGCTAPCDGSIGLSIPVSLAGAGPSSSTTIMTHTTYGANTPFGVSIGGTPCPYDCANDDGNVDTPDFLALLGQWGNVGTSCDPDNDGVDTIDFLALLGAWGPCP